MYFELCEKRDEDVCMKLCMNKISKGQLGTLRIIRTLHVHEYSNLTCTLITHIRVLYESLLIYAHKHTLLV